MIARELLNRSGYSCVDQTSDPATYVRRLDYTGAHEFWRMVKRHALALLDVREGAHLLDVGCGTGDDARSLARMVGPTGRVVGVDASITMITEARKRDEGPHVPVAFSQGDAHQLDFLDWTFDGCRAERVLQHLADPRLAVAEMVRVARPGAPIVLVEPDYGTLRIDGADRAVTNKILEHRRNHFLSGTVGRQLPRICKDNRLSGITVRLFGMAGADIAQEEEQLVLRKYAADAQAAGAISGTEAAAWLADLVDAGTKGRYRRAITIFLVSGRKP